MWKVLLWLIIIAAIIIAGLFLYSYIQPPAEGKTPDEDRAIRITLQNIGIEPTWQTIIVCASREMNLPKHTIWETWSHIEDWKRFSPQFVQSAKWIGEGGWKKGSRFEQTLSWGLPIGTETSVETIKTYSPELTVCYWRTTESTTYSNLWLFEEIPNGKTRVITVEVIHGSYTWLYKPLVLSKWQATFSEILEGLLLRALRGGRL